MDLSQLVRAESTVNESNAIVVMIAEEHSSQVRRTILGQNSLSNCTMPTMFMVLQPNSWQCIITLLLERLTPLSDGN